MNKTFFKNCLTIMYLVISLLVMVLCVVAAILYNQNLTISIVIAVGGILCTFASMIYNYNKKGVFKRIKVTDQYIEVLSTFKLGFRINFEDVLSCGKLSMAVTQASHESYYFSTENSQQNPSAFAPQTAITFDRTPQTEVVFKYICDKYNFSQTDF